MGQLHAPAPLHQGKPFGNPEEQCRILCHVSISRTPLPTPISKLQSLMDGLMLATLYVLEEIDMLVYAIVGAFLVLFILITVSVNARLLRLEERYRSLAWLAVHGKVGSFTHAWFAIYGDCNDLPEYIKCDCTSCRRRKVE